MRGSLEKYVHVEHVMGTAVTFDVRGARPRRQVIDDAAAWLHDVDAQFSTYRPDSAVCRLRRGELPRGAASDDLCWILDRCDRLHAETGGFFDAYASGSFDPSALVKGWAVQRAADQLAAAGVDRFCINAGGDIAARGRPAPGRRWRVGIRHPLDAKALAAIVAAEDAAVATSGLYERGGHVIAPVSGRAPAGVLSVTVVGPDLGTADAYATAALAMGTDGPPWTLGLEGYEALTILEDETVWATPGFPVVTA
jgi:thiamine biosynthesis lipoprotein